MLCFKQVDAGKALIEVTPVPTPGANQPNEAASAIASGGVGSEIVNSGSAMAGSI